MLTFLLDDNRTGAGALLFETPAKLVRADRPDEVEAALGELAKAQAEGLYAAGFLSFELGYLMESRLRALLPENRGVPLLLFGLFPPPQPMAAEEVETWLAGRGNFYALRNIRPSLSASAYKQKFDRTRAYIAAGDIYQLNLTFKARFGFEGSPAALYRDLRLKQHVQYGAYIEAEDFSLLSLSPELFIEVKDGAILTRPMKGTAPRGLTLADDRALAAELAADLKQRAENLMIVDLMRNDVTRIARPGTVKVPDLFTVEAYDTVLQMTSGVEADLQEGLGFREILGGLFPPGSITGAPKLRAVEIIRELEDEPRGVYTGAIGVIEPGGDCRFNVAIRTVRIEEGCRGEIGIGSGVVQDSRAQAEYDECLLKMRFLTDSTVDFDLLETLRFDEGRGYYLLDRHLARLAATAERFSFALDMGAVRRLLDEEAQGFAGPHQRVRLTLSRDGRANVTSQPLTLPSPDSVYRVALAETRLDPLYLFLYHKTTNRAFYDEERVKLSAATGCDEVIFLNTRGELTEGSFTTLFLEMEPGGILYTPALTSGLLAGTLREELIAQKRAEEAVLTLADLAAAKTIWLGNSVRGLVRAELTGGLPSEDQDARPETAFSP